MSDDGRVSEPALQHRIVAEVSAFDRGGYLTITSDWDFRRDWVVSTAQTLKEAAGVNVEVETRRVHMNADLSKVPEDARGGESR